MWCGSAPYISTSYPSTMRNESETEALQVQRAAVETKFLRLQTDLHAVLDANEEITTENKNKVRAYISIYKISVLFPCLNDLIYATFTHSPSGWSHCGVRAGLQGHARPQPHGHGAATACAYIPDDTIHAYIHKIITILYMHTTCYAFVVEMIPGAAVPDRRPGARAGRGPDLAAEGGAGEGEVRHHKSIYHIILSSGRNRLLRTLL